MRSHNDGNDDRPWKAHSRKWGKVPVAYEPIADIDLIARNTGKNGEQALEKSTPRQQSASETSSDNQPSRNSCLFASPESYLIQSDGTR